MKETISNYAVNNLQYTVVKDGSMYFVECRQGGFLTKTVPFTSVHEATQFASSHGHSTSQLLNESK